MRATLGVLFAAACVVVPALAGTLPSGNAGAGRQFYRTGLNRQAHAVPVTVQGDVHSNSARFTCRACHRPSGYGGSEGGAYVPIISAPVLFSPRAEQKERRNRRFRDLFKALHSADFDTRVRMPRMRPAYTRATLARAIEHGIDAAGRPLAPAMPRYQLGDQTAADLIAYLKTLSAGNSPGVGEHTLHLATVVSDGVAPAKRAAMLATLRAFVDWYNEDIRGQITHRGFSPYYRSDFKRSFKPWTLHVWRLHGAPASWGDQLRDYYARQPAFAVVSGLVAGPWRPVDRFCERKSLPCVFPNTHLPPRRDTRYGYSIYFSRGLALEGAALAKYLATARQPPRKIIQIRMAAPAGAVPAAAFSQAAKRTLPTTPVTDVRVSTPAALRAAIANAAGRPTGVLAIWPGQHTTAAVEALNAHPPAANRIVLPATALASARKRLDKALRPRLRLTFPYERPGAYHPRRYRVRAWFGSRRVALTHPRLQLQTYYALTMMQYAVADLVNDFNRDYLIEFIEHEAEAKLDPGIYPELALGPGQRFASKGAYIVALDAGHETPGYHAVSDWIVP